MSKTKWRALATATMIGMFGGAKADTVDVERYQPSIVPASAPEIQHRWSIPNNLRRTGLRDFAQIVDAYNGKGRLLASWNPRARAVADHPTFIIVHGGHGVSPANFAMAQWLIQELDASVLILDSYWSRGKTENWLTWNEFGANMRMLDAIAAGRFTRAQGADPRKTFLVGDSQGGWTALRTFTSGHSMEGEVKTLFRGGIALYPNCYAKESIFSSAPNGNARASDSPPLGPYSSPLIVFTGTADSATPTSLCNVEKALRSAEQWLSFEGATHAWDAPSNGAGTPLVDGACGRADNIYNRFPVCTSVKYTEITREKIKEFVGKHIPRPASVDRPAPIAVAPAAPPEARAGLHAAAVGGGQQQLRDGTYDGTMRCGPLLVDHAQGPWIEPIQLRATSDVISWRRGNTRYSETGTGALRSGRLSLLLEGAWLPGDVNIGKWRTVAVLNLDGDKITGPATILASDGQQPMRHCLIEVGVGPVDSRR